MQKSSGMNQWEFPRDRGSLNDMVWLEYRKMQRRSGSQSMPLGDSGMDGGRVPLRSRWRDKMSGGKETERNSC